MMISLSVIFGLFLITIKCTTGQIVFQKENDINSNTVLSSSTVSAEIYYCDKNNVQIQRWEVPSHLTGQNEPVVFLFKIKDVSCKINASLQTYFMNSKREFQFQKDGYLRIGSSDFSDYYHPTQYCIAGLTDTEISFKTCSPACTPEEPCIQKCCPLDSIYDSVTGACVLALPTKWSAKVFKVVSDPKSYLTEKELIHIHPYYRVRHPRTFKDHCLDEKSGLPRVQLMAYNKQGLDNLIASGLPEGFPLVFRFRAGADGRVRYRNDRRKWVPLPHDDYCVDGLNFVIQDKSQHFNNTLDEEILWACPPPLDLETREVSEYFGIFAITSSIFALVTVIVYFLLFDKQTIHGWTTMSHSSSVFLFYIFLGTAHLSKDDLHVVKTVGCKFIGTMAHYFFISTFCWLLMISFDLWSTFRSITAASRKKGLRRFLGYCCFAWGVPALIITVAWSLEAKFANDEDSEIAVPMYGEDFCYLSHHFYWEFLYGPNAVLLAINLALFIFTSVKLYQYQRDTEVATKNMNKDRQSFLLFVKLSFFVGVLWIFEIVSASVSGTDIPWYWQIFDTLNLLQPVAIFVIFVLKWEIINELHMRYVLLRPVVYPARKLLQCLCPKEDKKYLLAASEASHSTRYDSSAQTLNR